MAWQIWVAIAIALVIAEIFSLTFYLILFAVGALGAALSQALGLSLSYQVGIFVVISIILAVFVQPILKRTFVVNHQGRPSNTDALVGQRGYVAEEVTGDRGLVKVNGETWSARSLDGQILAPGTLVEVIRVEGAKLLVKEAP
ncbi:NfeD family protein [Moorella sp. Hama-1]|uniref:NfeD family protein n=1 Tax=Moorella sp. Hama-1 TaxID=2138101 RepID=UPI000D64431E|nr:NfeD family protein [Moorella sp. Hama-1]MDN5361882.1 hypothetical protein [Moorella sp. (in: firmicutes)]BCV21406.1 membrane protein [Moorella sp. Hama-1]